MRLRYRDGKRLLTASGRLAYCPSVQCLFCGGAAPPEAFEVVIAGFVSGAFCTDCDLLNGTYIVPFDEYFVAGSVQVCFYRLPLTIDIGSAGGCDMDRIEVRLTRTDLQRRLSIHMFRTGPVHVFEQEKVYPGPVDCASIVDEPINDIADPTEAGFDCQVIGSIPTSVVTAL